jgi:Rieske 2Fe-2S family protein
MVIQSTSEPAPLDPAALAMSLRPFGHSRMLPRAAYTDPAVFAWEQEHFFADGWICIGLSEEIAEPGDQTSGVGGFRAGMLLTRAQDKCPAGLRQRL